MTVKDWVLSFKPFLPISRQTLALNKPKQTILFWSCPREHVPHQCPDFELLCDWEPPTRLWARVAQSKGRNCLVSVPSLGDDASTYTQRFLEAEAATAQPHLPKPVIKAIHQHPAGSWEHNPKITGFHLNQSVLMKHEKQSISAKVEAKDRSDQTDRISSAGLDSLAVRRGL